jgi:ketosteroid isomerase-like protein
MSNEELVRRYIEATVAGDLEGEAALRHPEWSVHWPQSGERVIDEASYDQIIRNYPGGSPTSRVKRIAGTEDRYVATPSGTLARVGGQGDFWVGEWEVTYPDGVTYLCVDLMDLRDGKVWRETVYWAPLFDAPAWRGQWVVRGDDQG